MTATPGTALQRSTEATLRRFRVPLGAIAYVRMILEAYDGLAVMVSRRGAEIVEWWIAPGREAEADALARALAAEIGLAPLDPDAPGVSSG